MITEKERLLEEVHRHFVEISLNAPGSSLDGADAFIVDDVMGYGTAITEKIISFSDYCELLKVSKAQSVGWDMALKIIPVFRKTDRGGNMAIYVDEAILTMNIEGQIHRLFVRITMAFEYTGNTWKAVHFHASKPEETSSSDDTWHVDEWKARNAELEKMVAEKTAALEIKNNELEIEVALEKVRAIALSMKEPADMLEVCRTISHQLEALGVEGIRNIQTAIIHESKGTYWNYEYFRLHNKTVITEVEYNLHADIAAFVNQMLKGPDAFFTSSFEGNQLKDLMEYQKDAHQFVDPQLKEAKSLHYYFYSIGPGALGISAYSPLNEQELGIFKRFHNVFQLAYRRYTDVELAMAQAREAKIEAALERVRSRTMAMHKSDELQEVSKIIIQQIVFLNFPLFGFGIHICHENEPVSKAWIGDPTKGQVPTVLYEHTHDSLSKLMYKGWKDGESLLVKKVQGEELKEHFEYMVSITPISSIFETTTPPEFIIYHFAYFSHGLFVIAMLSPYEEAQSILKRFAKVFEQTYTRFLDLQKAEVQAREALVEAALERVRSRTLAMHKSDELAETAAEIFKQLIGLGIEPNRLYIGIAHEDNGEMEMWGTDEDGTQVGQKYIFNKNENASVKKLYDGWAAKEKSLIVDMEGKELEDYFHYLNEVMHLPFKDGLIQKRRVQSVAYFSKGFIGMASPDGQGSETLQLLERFAAVFNLTFTRFNDLKIAEAHALQAKEDLIKLQTEKKRAEDALTELKSTQTQLIQSEKMASLGELTAGIAHEIQNPLNFVNNFSEVNVELIDEMEEAVLKSDREEIISIAADIKQNLQKIIHHGKRADAIVKGMLQHSRSSSGIKESTDINALADEYLRLAYHGLRAKDKSFNATIVTDYDDCIGMINIIPQDIGRVLLNLFTNAFYAVSDKKKRAGTGYEPTVSLSTRKTGNQTEIIVTDNGTGIPEKILNKIFQPFFTTKPTGEGTGLGLSIGYDIIQAHGGSLNVKNSESGAEFQIILGGNYA